MIKQSWQEEEGESNVKMGGFDGFSFFLFIFL